VVADAVSELLRVYAITELKDGRYPYAWDRCPRCLGTGVRPPDGQYAGVNYYIDPDVPSEEVPGRFMDAPPPCECEGAGSIKGLVRQLAEHRCERCGHPFEVGAFQGEWTAEVADAAPPATQLFDDVDVVIPPGRSTNWSMCDTGCHHGGPARYLEDAGGWSPPADPDPDALNLLVHTRPVQAAWRILTVHHLNERKADCRWWNLAALCQRCHLEIQGKVAMAQVWPLEHSEWFKPHAAGFYAASYLGEELDRAATMERLDELLALERA
jgi:hypothetical protein